MPLVYLRESTALIQAEAGDPAFVGKPPVDAVVYERNAVLVYTGTFRTMSGEVITVTDEEIELLAADRKDTYTKLLGGMDVTYDELAPLQTDHSRSSWDTVGRVVRTWVDTFRGKKALFGRLRFLGQDAVDRAKDGRWTHLSVAADFKKGYLKELTVTPFPAAGGAVLLSQGEDMDPKLVAHLMKIKNLSEADATKLATEMSEADRGVLVAQLAEDPNGGPKPLDDAEAKAKADKEAADKLAADEAAKVAALAAPPVDPAVKRLSEAKGKISELARGLRRGSRDLGQELRVAQLSESINALRAEGKITPAEVKKIDVKKLSEASVEAQDLVIASYRGRQPVVFMGSFGSAAAPNVTDALKKGADDKMLKEMSQDMQFSKGVVKQLCGGEAAAASTNGSQNLTDSGMPAMSMMSHFKHLSSLMEGGKHDECKAYLAKMMSDGEASIAPPVDPDTEKRMSGVAENLKKLQNQVDEFVALFCEAAGVEVTELA